LEHERRDFLKLCEQCGPINRRLTEPGAQRIVVSAEPVQLAIECI